MANATSKKSIGKTLTKEDLNMDNVREYHTSLVLSFLILRAATRSTATYEDINEHLEQRGLNWLREPADVTANRELTRYLTDIFNWCRDRNQPQLTSLVVRKSGADQGLPGRGFWNLLNPDNDLRFVNIDDRKTKVTLTQLFQNQAFNFYSI